MSIDRIVDFLNEAFRQDPDSVCGMFHIQVDADEEAIMHPHIQVTSDHKVRLIGLLNGLIGDTQNRLAMKLDDETGAVLGFCVVTVGN
jgi:hypothetical protein